MSFLRSLKTKLGFPKYFDPELEQEWSSKSRPGHIGLLRRMRAGPYNYSAATIWGAIKSIRKDGGYLIRNYLGDGVALVLSHQVARSLSRLVVRLKALYACEVE